MLFIRVWLTPRKGICSSSSCRRLRPIPEKRKKISTGHLKVALQLLDQHEIDIDSSTYASLLRQCGEAKALIALKRVHSHILARNEESLMKAAEDVLVEMYGKCGDCENARKVFDGIVEKSVFSWNVMIRSYSHNGFGREALDVYHQMDIQPNAITFITALGACCTAGALEDGKAIHDRVLAGVGLNPNVILETAIVNMYGRCGCLEEAKNMFEKMRRRNVVSWNAMITAYAQNGYPVEAIEMYHRMEPERINPDKVTFLCVLNACSLSDNLADGVLIHEHIVSLGFELDHAVSNSLINMYGKCGDLESARGIFDKMSTKDLVSWNAMIAAYTQKGHHVEAMEIYQQMDSHGIIPDTITFTIILAAICTPDALAAGVEMHKSIISRGFASNVILETSLLSMYGKCGSVQNARQVFDKMQSKNVVSWNAMITAYVQYGYDEDAIQLFRKMANSKTAVKPDQVTFLTIIATCKNLDECKHIHAQIVASSGANAKTKLRLNLSNALISVYASCGSLNDAREIFDSLNERNVVTWTAMLMAYCEEGQGKDAMRIYRNMLLEGVKPDMIACVGGLDACASVGSMVEGKSIHEFVKLKGLQNTVIMGTALLNMYGKCGNYNEARSVFDQMVLRNEVTWNAMIAAYAQHGHGLKALKLHGLMDLEGIKPDATTYICLLFTCSHLGLIEKGRGYFSSMIEDHDITPNTEHYGCIVDLLGRMGWIDEAENVLKNMPVEPSNVAWSTLLNACSIHNDIERGARVARHVHELDPKSHSPFVMLSNISKDIRFSISQKTRR